MFLLYVFLRVVSTNQYDTQIKYLKYVPLSDKYFIFNIEKQESKGAEGGKDDTESKNAGGKDDSEIKNAEGGANPESEIKNAEGGANPESEKTVRKLICKQLDTNVLQIFQKQMKQIKQQPLSTNKTTTTEYK